MTGHTPPAPRDEAAQPVATTGWVFSTMHLPRPLKAEQVDAMLLRLAADHAAPPLVFEVRAQHGHLVRHFIGTPAEHVRWVQRTLRDLLPGLELDGLTHQPVASTAGATATRPPVQRAVRVRVRPRALALARDRAELTSRSLLSALDVRLQPGEQLALQVALGPRVMPAHLPEALADPTQPWWQLLLRGQIEADQPVRRQIDDRRGQHGFAACLRIGVSAANPQRRQQLVMGVLGALSTAQERGTYLDLSFEPTRRFNQPRLPWWWPVRLGASEVTGLLGWPLGETDVPGVAPLHPRPLRVPISVNRQERLFAVPGAPGPTGAVGIAARDITAHLVAVGPTGVGKSTALLHLIKADIAAGRPVLVIDPKWQLIRDIIDRAVPRSRMDDVVIIDPSDAAATGRIVGLNPLDVGERDPDVVIDGLVAVFKAIFHEGWGPRTEDVVHSGLLTLARVGTTRKTPFTLLDLPRLLTDAPFRTSVVGAVLDDPGLGSFWAWYLSLTAPAQAQAIAAPLNKLRQYLLRPSLRAILGQAQPPFRLRDVFSTNKVVLVALNEALIGPITAQLLGSLIVAETWSATLERATEPDPAAHPATVVIDEVQRYLNLPTSIEDALNRSRSLGVGWHLAHQFRAQLPPSTRAAVDSNAKSKIVFQPLDPDDAQAMAKRAPDLEAIDFLSLGQFQAYANLTASGTPAGWALVRTLPPPKPTGLGELVRARSHERYAGAVPGSPSSASAATAAAASQADLPNDSPVGRKKRSQS